MRVQRRSRAAPSDPFPASCRKGCGADGGGGGGGALRSDVTDPPVRATLPPRLDAPRERTAQAAAATIET